MSEVGTAPSASPIVACPLLDLERVKSMVSSASTALSPRITSPVISIADPVVPSYVPAGMVTVVGLVKVKSFPAPSMSLPEPALVISRLLQRYGSKY